MALAEKEEERTALAWLDDFELLRHLLSLELTRAEYERHFKIGIPRRLRPSEMLRLLRSPAKIRGGQARNDNDVSLPHRGYPSPINDLSEGLRGLAAQFSGRDEAISESTEASRMDHLFKKAVGSKIPTSCGATSDNISWLKMLF